MTRHRDSGTDTLPLPRVVAVAVSSATEREWQSYDMSWQCSEQVKRLNTPARRSRHHPKEQK